MRRSAMAFAELCITSNFTFLTGGSHPQEYALRAIELGLPAFAIADRNSVAGLVRAHQELREAARGGGAVPRLLPAARLCLAEGGPELTALPRDRAGWGRLCRVLSRGALRAEKGACLLRRGGPGGPGRDASAAASAAGAGARRLAAARPARSPGGIRARTWWRARATTGRTAARIERAARLAGELGLGLVASAEPIMHHGSRRRLVDVLTCIREGLRIDRDRPGGAGQRRAAAAARGGDAAALRRPRGGGAPRGGDRRGLPLRARRACATSIRARSGTARTRRRGWSG